MEVNMKTLDEILKQKITESKEIDIKIEANTQLKKTLESDISDLNAKVKEVTSTLDAYNKNLLKIDEELTKNQDYSDAKTPVIVAIIDKEYLFSWEKFTGNDTGRLIEFLMRKFGIKWVKEAKITKFDDKTIKGTNDTHSLSIELNGGKTNADLMIDGDKKYEFIVKTENGELKIYGSEKKDIEDKIKKFDDDYDKLKKEIPKLEEKLKDANKDYETSNDNFKQAQNKYDSLKSIQKETKEKFESLKKLKDPIEKAYENDEASKMYLFMLEFNRIKDELKPLIRYTLKWDEIDKSETNKERLKEFLNRNFELPWVNEATITKDDSTNTIEVKKDTDVLTIKRNDDGTQATVENPEFIIKLDKGILNIFESELYEVLNKLDSAKNDLRSKEEAQKAAKNELETKQKEEKELIKNRLDILLKRI